MIRRILVSVCTILVLTGIGLADTWKTLQEQFNEVKEMNYLNQVGVYFIDPITNATPKEYTLNLKQEQNETVRLRLNNDADQDLHLRIAFADQQLSNGGSRGCGADYENGFAKFIKPNRKGDIIIPKKSTIEKTFDVLFPVGIEWLQRWCIAYGVNEDKTTIQDNKENPDVAIQIIKRKVIYIDAVVGGTGFIDYHIEVWNIKTSFNESGDMIIEVPVENKGNVDATISMEGDISNILSYQRTINGSGVVKKWSSLTLSANVWPLPFYKGLYSIGIVVKHAPKFGFNATKAGVNPNIIAGEKETISKLYFWFHRWMLIILFIGIMMRRKPRTRQQKKSQTTTNTKAPEILEILKQ